MIWPHTTHTQHTQHTHTHTRMRSPVLQELTDFDLATLNGRAPVVDLADVDAVAHVARDVEAQADDVLALQPHTDLLRTLGTDRQTEVA